MNMIREFMVSRELRGSFPTIETADNIDVKELEGDDPSPLYVTLAVAEINKTSANGLLYDAPLVTQLTQQIPGKWGIFGHINWMNESTAFPKAEVYWVGTALQGDVLWAKGYVPPGDARETVRRLKASGAGIGTSIYGPGEREYVAEGQYKLIDFELNQLDFAPTDRAALRMNSPVRLTAEMAINSEGKELTKEQVLAALTATDIDLLPRGVIEAVLAKNAPTATQVNDLEAQMRVLEAQAQTKDNTIAELNRRLGEFTRKQFEADLRGLVAELIKWNTPTDDAANKLAVLRETFYTAVLAALMGSTEISRARTVAAELWETQYRVIAETMRDALAGPSAIVGAKPQANWRDEAVKNAPSIASRWGGN